MASGEIKKGWWLCGKGHVFYHGDKDWHVEASQPEGAPTHCWWFEGEDGIVCGDSTHLWGPFPTDKEAEEARSDPSIVRWLKPWNSAEDPEIQLARLKEEVRKVLESAVPFISAWEFDHDVDGEEFYDKLAQLVGYQHPYQRS